MLLAVFASRGYAGADSVVSVQAQGCEAVIPPHQSSKNQRTYNIWLYRGRYLIECYINKLKHFRHIFSRFDKLNRSYLGFVHFVCTLPWLC